MNLFISFSARQNGNCGRIAEYLANPEDSMIHFKDLNFHSCSNCEYSCFSGHCIYHDDDIYGLYDRMPQYDHVILLVPMYCDNPSSLYFVFTERIQEFYVKNSAGYDDLVKKLYIIGVYGSKAESPLFIPSLSQWFKDTDIHHHVLGLERRPYQQKIKDSLLDIREIRDRLSQWKSDHLLTSLAQPD